MSFLTRFTSVFANNDANALADAISERLKAVQEGKANKPELIKEIIGRVAVPRNSWRYKTFPNIDDTRIDYAYWDDLRNCRARGFQLSGLFCRPTAEIITAATYGDGLKAALTTIKAQVSGDEDYTNAELSAMLRRRHGLLLTMDNDLMGLADQYVVVNPNGTFSIPSPETVEPVFDPRDPMVAIGYTITTNDDQATYVEEFTRTGRTKTITYKKPWPNEQIVRPPEIDHFSNLIGRIPVVHFKNRASANERFGRPETDGLYRLLSRMNDLMEKSIDGGETAGNPLPVMEGMENIDDTARANFGGTTDTFINEDGDQQARPEIDWDENKLMMVSKGGSFKWAGPNVGFSADILNILRFLFLMIQVYTRIAEYFWGGQISSGRSSTQEQAKPWEQFIKGRRAKLEGYGDEEEGGIPLGGLLELIDIWLRTRRLTDPRIVVGAVTIDWPRFGSIDPTVQFQWLNQSKLLGLITDEQYVMFGRIIENPKVEIERAQKEAKDKAAEAAANQPVGQNFGGRLDTVINGQSGGAAADTQPGATTTSPPSSNGHGSPTPEKIAA